MGITIQAENVQDAAAKLGVESRRRGINITWRVCDQRFDFERLHETGCVVDATDIQGEEVERCFKTSGEALRYVASLLKKHDAYARELKKQHDKRQRELLKKAKGEKKCL